MNIKSLSVIALTLFCSFSSHADQQCTVVLESSYGEPLEEFSVTDYSYEHACSVAFSDCTNSQSSRNGEYAQCRIRGYGNSYPDGEYDNHGGNRNGDRYTNRCQASLRSRNNQVIRTFFGTGFNQQSACQNAIYQCQQFSQNDRRHPYATCQLDQGGYPGPRPGPYPGPRPGPYPGPRPGPGNQLVTCEYGLFDAYSGGNYPIRRFEASSRGSYYQDAVTRACQMAEQFCRQRLTSPRYRCQKLRIY